MARLRHRAAEAGLREYLLEDAIAFRDRCGRLSDEAYAELSGPVDQLLGGEPCRLHGWMLPPDHPARADYGPNADLVLTADDRLLAYADWLAADTAAMKLRLSDNPGHGT